MIELIAGFVSDKSSGYYRTSCTLGFGILDRFLGYPSKCCFDFFDKKMNKKFIETWNMALNKYDQRSVVI